MKNLCKITLTISSFDKIWMSLWKSFHQINPILRIDTDITLQWAWLRPNSWNIRVFFDALADSVFKFLHYLTILYFIFYKYLLSLIFVLSIKPEKSIQIRIHIINHFTLQWTWLCTKGCNIRVFLDALAEFIFEFLQYSTIPDFIFVNTY